jgi:hypothetical protein
MSSLSSKILALELRSFIFIVSPWLSFNFLKLLQKCVLGKCYLAEFIGLPFLLALDDILPDIVSNGLDIFLVVLQALLLVVRHY